MALFSAWSKPHFSAVHITLICSTSHLISTPPRVETLYLEKELEEELEYHNKIVKQQYMTFSSIGV